MISIFHNSNEPDCFAFDIDFEDGLWFVYFSNIDDNCSRELECRYKSKRQALEYVGLRLINFYE